MRFEELPLFGMGIDAEIIKKMEARIDNLKEEIKNLKKLAIKT